MALLVQRGDSLELGSILINFQISITIWNVTEGAKKKKKKLHDRDQFSSKLSPKLNVSSHLVLFSSFGVERNLKVNALVKSEISKIFYAV